MNPAPQKPALTPEQAVAAHRAGRHLSEDVPLARVAGDWTTATRWVNLTRRERALLMQRFGVTSGRGWRKLRQAIRRGEVTL